MYPKHINDMVQRNKKIRLWKKEELRKQKLLKKDWISLGGKTSQVELIVDIFSVL